MWALMTLAIDTRRVLPRMLQTVNIPDISPSQVDFHSHRNEVGREWVSPLHPPSPAKPVTNLLQEDVGDARFRTSVSQVPCVVHS